MKTETKCLHSGYTPENGQADALPIYQSTTFKYDSAEHMGELFDLKAAGYFYSRLANPTVGYVEEKIADLEGGVGAMMTSSGQAANFFAVINILSAGDHLIATSQIYGGSTNLLGVTLKKMGIETTFVDQEASEEDIQKEFRSNTKAVFGETIANPAISVLDIEKFAKIAHKNGVPFIIDNTFATPVLCRPIEFGADIVTHSTTKYMDGHGVQLGGVIIDSGKFDWEASGKFSCLTQPDESYHGTIYTQAFGPAAYLTKSRVTLMRDIGAAPTAEGAFLLNLGLETLALRIQRHSENALKVAKFLKSSDKIKSVSYPGLVGDYYYERAQKYLPEGQSGVISLCVKGGRERAMKLLDSLKLVRLCVHVAMVRSCALHPASSTHRQLSDEQLIAAGITPDLIRISVGIEDADDIIADLEQALSCI